MLSAWSRNLGHLARGPKAAAKVCRAMAESMSDGFKRGILILQRIIHLLQCLDMRHLYSRIADPLVVGLL